MENRYNFFKKLFPEYVILIDNKTFGLDTKLKQYMKNKDINYITVDSNNNINIFSCKENNYKYYAMRIFLFEFITDYLESFMLS